jgi:hypothetical protein
MPSLRRPFRLIPGLEKTLLKARWKDPTPQRGESDLFNRCGEKRLCLRLTLFGTLEEPVLICSRSGLVSISSAARLRGLPSSACSGYCSRQHRWALSSEKGSSRVRL